MVRMEGSKFPSPVGRRLARHTTVYSGSSLRTSCDPTTTRSLRDQRVCRDSCVRVKAIAPVSSSLRDKKRGIEERKTSR